MAKRGKRAAKTNAPPTKREVDDFFRTLTKYGLEELNRAREPYQKSKRKRGRPLNDSFTDISVSETPWEGLYLVRFKIGRAAPLICVAVKPKGVRLPKGLIKIATPHQAIGEIIKTLWEAYEKTSRDNTLSTAERENWKPARLGASVDAITRRLTSEFRKKAKPV